jgi:hypothetical protein
MPAQKKPAPCGEARHDLNASRLPTPSRIEYWYVALACASVVLNRNCRCELALLLHF